VASHSQDELSVDPTSLTVTRGNRCSLVLTPKEFQIVALMHQAPNCRLSREEMISRVWGTVTVSAKTLDVHLFHLRKKLAPLSLDILFVPPQSYRLLTRDQK
jgi:DNA-binding response OmpR family regulator